MQSKTDEWIDVHLVTETAPYAGCAQVSEVSLQRGEQVVYATAESAAEAVSKAIEKWKARER